MASISAAVTVFGRQAREVCLCDTDKIYLAAEPTMQHVFKAPQHKCVSLKPSISLSRLFFFF